MSEQQSRETPGSRGWQFVTNHTQVLLAISRDPDLRLRDIADDLVDAGFVTRERRGRRNRYVIDRGSDMLRHEAQGGRQIGGLLDLLELNDRSD